MKELDRQVAISIENYIATGDCEHLDDVMRLYEFYGFPSQKEKSHGGNRD